MFKILIMGLPGSGKTTFANRLIKEFNSVSYYNADEIRKSINDWDFSQQGRLRQNRRMLYYANNSKTDFVICDFVAPLEKIRQEFDADYVIWMDTLKKGRYKDTNKIFETPTNYDLRVTDFDTEKYIKLFHQDMKKFYNIYDDNDWVILSPGRTGSVLLSNIITKVFNERRERSKFEFKKLYPNIFVSHQHSNITTSFEDLNFIINIRDPIEISLSLLIQPHIGKWHLTKEDEITIDPFYLNPYVFNNTYKDIISWHYEIPKEILKKAVIINYNEFCQNPIVDIPKILNLPKVLNYKNEMIKNPGTPKDWISNWNEIERILSNIREQNNQFIKHQPWLT